MTLEKYVKMDIYVGNLPYSAMDADLKKLFQEYGTVRSAKVVVDHETGKSKGFGFVDMPKQNEAEKALVGMQNYEFQGRSMHVNESRPRAPRKDKPNSEPSRRERRQR